MNQADLDIMKTVDMKLDQAKRNAEQGELGRTLAMSKVSEIKMSFAQVKENFIKETQDAVANSNELPDDDAMGMDIVLGQNPGQPDFDLKKKQSNLAQLEKKKSAITKRFPQLHNIEVMLGLPDDVED